jgi:hypothetical protein
MTALALALSLVAAAGIGGDVRSRLHLRTAALDSAAVSWFETRAALEFAPELGERVSAKLGVEFRADAFPQLASLGELGNAGRFEPVTVLLGESYVRLHDALPGLAITAGRQLVHWGTADAVNPTDNWNAPDYSDPLVWDARRPAWMLHADYSPLPELGLELAARPVFEPALSVPARWYRVDFRPDAEELRAGLVSEFIGRGLDSATARAVAGMYTININEDFALPGNRLRDMSWGGRVRTRLGSFDFSASLLRGYDFLPTALPVTTIDTQALSLDFTLRQRFARRTVIGGDAATSLGGFGLWAEAAYSRYDDSPPANELAIIGGVDYTLAGIYLNAQYLHGRFPLALAGAGEPATEFILAALERKFFAEQLLLRLGGAVDLDGGSAALLPLVRWLVADAVELDLGGIIFTGPDGAAFAPLGGCDEVFAGCRWRF